MSFLYYNGAVIQEGTPTIALPNQSVEFGEGVFTSMRLNNGRLEGYYKHLQRVEKNAHDIGLHNLPKIEEDTVKAFIAKCSALSGVWRLKLIVLQSGHINQNSADVYMYVRSYVAPSVTSVRLIPYPFSISPELGGIKSLCYHARRSLRTKAQNSGFYDFIGYDYHGKLLEASHSNIFWIQDDVLYTPDSKLGLLEGVFITTLIDAWKRSGKKIVLAQSPLDELVNSCSVFMCNSLSWALPVAEIGNRSFTVKQNLLEEITSLVDKAYIKSSLYI